MKLIKFPFTYSAMCCSLVASCFSLWPKPLFEVGDVITFLIRLPLYLSFCWHHLICHVSHFDSLIFFTLCSKRLRSFVDIMACFLLASFAIAFPLTSSSSTHVTIWQPYDFPLGQSIGDFLLTSWLAPSNSLCKFALTDITYSNMCHTLVATSKDLYLLRWVPQCYSLDGQIFAMYLSSSILLPYLECLRPSAYIIAFSHPMLFVFWSCWCYLINTWHTLIAS